MEMVKTYDIFRRYHLYTSQYNVQMERDWLSNVVKLLDQVKSLA